MHILLHVHKCIHFFAVSKQVGDVHRNRKPHTLLMLAGRPPLRVSDLKGLGWGLRLYISSELLGDAAAAGLGTPL